MAEPVALDQVDQAIDALIKLAIEAQLQEGATAGEAAAARLNLQLQIDPLPELLIEAQNMLLATLEEALCPVLNAALGLDDDDDDQG